MKESTIERISVTQAVRQFSDLMNRVFYQGTTVEIERGNKVIARISPVSPQSPLKVKDLNRFFHELPLLDDESEAFAEALADLRKHIPMERNQRD